MTIDAIQAQIIEARRNQILDAAAKVFAERGFHPTTIKDIAKEAGIADGTIYNYFKNKSALLIGIFERMRDTIMTQTPLPNTDEMELEQMLGAFLSHPFMALQADNFALFRVVMSEMMVNEELRALYYQQILEPTLQLAEAHLQGLADKNKLSYDVIPLLVRTISGMVTGLMLEAILGDEILTEKWADMPHFLTNLLMNGLGHIS